MKPLKAAEIRTTFLEYFKKHGHSIVESASLVPSNDPTLLFVNAGMVPFKDVFLGKETRPYQRATSSQKCVRAGGKHNDLENVGFTARHHTFFEMLGNFSFGNYFKKEAIKFAWNFVTKELAIPKDVLSVTVFTNDDEAAEIWHKQEGVPKEKVSRFGEKDNFWSMGDTGPCGPCTEIFVDRGVKYGCGKKTCAVGCDCDRFMEIWNIVFMQFNRDSSGTLNPLPKPSVDTGAGLERLASVLQNVSSNYQTDLFTDIISKTEKLARVPYLKNESTYHVIADHSRATAFLLADGVLPSNEGRGYVLRRIMRRAIRYGQKLEFQGPFFAKTCSFVIDQMEQAFPELGKSREFIKKAVQAEEELFLRTLERGLSLLEEATAGLSKGELPGDVAFKLYDTYGFPLDLTRVICSEKGLGVDEAGFEKLMDQQREGSRKAWKGSGQKATESEYTNIAEELKLSGKLPRFVGYTTLQVESECLWTQDRGENTVEAAFLETPFYPEGGGQVGDQGQVTGGDFIGKVLDCTKPAEGLIVLQLKVHGGTLQKGKRYLQRTDLSLRGLTARNHTATHMLQWALRKVLGDHVKQAGSLVKPELLRFDFSHFSAITPQELRKIEDLINDKIFQAQGVEHLEMSKDQALAAGAIAFFGEKYGDQVRVIKVGDFSTELCGGTHVRNSNEIGLFKIGSESGIAAGVRRIIAYTSQGALDYLRSSEDKLHVVRDTVGASSVDEIIPKIERLQAQEKDLRKQLETLSARAASGEVDALLAKDFHRVIAQVGDSSEGIKKLRDLAERIKQKSPAAIIVLGCGDPDGSKAFLLAARGPKAPATFDSGKLIAAISPLIEGRGGGKADMAQAGGTKASGLGAALEQARKLTEI